jgi:hypothetical protein
MAEEDSAKDKQLQTYDVLETTTVSSESEEAAGKFPAKSHVFDDPDVAEHYREVYYENS